MSVVAVALLASLAGGSALDRATTQQVNEVVQFIAVTRVAVAPDAQVGQARTIGPDGLILTNCHVAYPSPQRPGVRADLLIVASRCAPMRPAAQLHRRGAVRRQLDLAGLITQT